MKRISSVYPHFITVVLDLLVGFRIAVSENIISEYGGELIMVFCMNIVLIIGFRHIFTGVNEVYIYSVFDFNHKRPKIFPLAQAEFGVMRGMPFLKVLRIANSKFDVLYYPRN